MGGGAEGSNWTAPSCQCPGAVEGRRKWDLMRVKFPRNEWDSKCHVGGECSLRCGWEGGGPEPPEHRFDSLGQWGAMGGFRATEAPGTAVSRSKGAAELQMRICLEAGRLASCGGNALASADKVKTLSGHRVPVCSCHGGGQKQRSAFPRALGTC